MKYKGVEYRILENGAKDSYRVEILEECKFMGFSKTEWRPLRAEYYPYRVCSIKGPTLTLKKGFTSYIYGGECFHEFLIETFSTCKEAKKAAKDFINRKELIELRKQWHECKC